MKAIRWLICGVAAVYFITGAPAWADGTLDVDAFKLYGGIYSPDCGNSTAPRLRVLSDALIVEQERKRLTGRNVQPAYSFFGQSPPPNYQVVLLAEVRGQQLLFIVYRDKSGQYIELSGDNAVIAALGKRLTEVKYRDCDPAAHRLNDTPAKAPSADATSNTWDPLRDAHFKSAYYRALDHKVKESWMSKLDGLRLPAEKIKIGATEYVLFGSCKNHDCGDNNAVLLYSPTKKVVYGKVFQRGKITLLGAPPPAITSELDRLWAAQWRQNP